MSAVRMPIGVLFSFSSSYVLRAVSFTPVLGPTFDLGRFFYEHTASMRCGLERFSTLSCPSRECSSELQVPRPTRLPISPSSTRSTETPREPWNPTGILAIRGPERLRSRRIDAFLQGRLEARRRAQSP